MVGIRRRHPGIEARRRPRTATPALHAFLIVGAVVTLYPLVWMVSSSLKPENEIFSQATSLLPGQLHPSNYVEGWNLLTEPFGVYIRNSIIVSGLAVVGTVASSAMVGYAFAKVRFRLRRMWFAAMLATIMLPQHATLVPQYVLFYQLHWVGTYLPLIVPHFLATNAFFVFLVVQFMRGIPAELEDAARVDGCGVLGSFWHVVLPLSKPALVTTAILSFIWSWDEFLLPLIYLSDSATYTVPLGLRLFLNGAGQSSWGPMFAMSVVSLVPVVVCFFLFQRQIVEGIATTGLKG